MISTQSPLFREGPGRWWHALLPPSPGKQTAEGWELVGVGGLRDIATESCGRERIILNPVTQFFFFSQNFHNGEPTNASPKDEKQFKTFFTSYDKRKQTLLWGYDERYFEVSDCLVFACEATFATVKLEWKKKHYKVKHDLLLSTCGTCQHDCGCGVCV